MSTGTPSQRAQRHFDAMETMPSGLRECILEFGSQIVNEIMQCGVTDPVKIRTIVQTCWMGARQPQNRIGGAEKQFKQPSVLDEIDWLLIQAGSPISAATLLRVLWAHSLVIVGREPSTAMIETSMATVTHHDEVMTKREKHRRRLRAAVDAGARRLWPHLYREGDAKQAERQRLEQEIT